MRYFFKILQYVHYFLSNIYLYLTTLTNILFVISYATSINLIINIYFTNHLGNIQVDIKAYLLFIIIIQKGWSRSLMHVGILRSPGYTVPCHAYALQLSGAFGQQCLQWALRFVAFDAAHLCVPITLQRDILFVLPRVNGPKGCL